ncbi:MAG: GNAT family N-acetyltransferase [Deltaproteobacteria bacterium]|nr:GNAT family N-acetyltransferase [Deltaproteobacteria bacterium]
MSRDLEKGQLGIMPCDFFHKGHCRAFKNIIASYVEDPMGGGTFTEENSDLLIWGLSRHSSSFTLFGIHEGLPAGVAVCFINYSTFKRAPFINIHDLAVLPKYRGLGIGKSLLAAVSIKAMDLECCKVTLEVRQDNKTAQALYKSFGFSPLTPPMDYWSKSI